MKVVTMPPKYSEVDAALLAAGRRRIAELEAEFRRKAEPIFEAMVEIENRYPPRYVVVPD